jgi:transposase
MAFHKCLRSLELRRQPYQGVSPDNNAAERALRHGLIWRKLSLGTASEAGSRFVERLLSVVETCRQ